jgi:hypothetical protein
LQLEEEELPETFDGRIADGTARLCEALETRYRRSVETLAEQLHEAAVALEAEPSPATMASLLRRFLSVLNEYRSIIRQERGAALWQLAAQYLELAEGLEQSLAGSEKSFRHLPAMVAALPWVEECLERLATRSPLAGRRAAELRSFSPRLGAALQREAEATVEGRFCAVAHRIQNQLEARLRQVWLLGEFRKREPSSLDLYAAAHAGLYPVFRPSPAAAEIGQEMARLREAAASAGLPEIAACFESADGLAHFSLLHLMPPDPPAWAPRTMTHFDRLLMGRVSRFYLYPFLHWPQPIELAATVLRLGRPQFYERTAAQALLEYSLLQRDLSFEPNRLGHYLDTIRVLEFQFQTHFEGYLLRIYSYPSLKTPEGWCRYFDALRRLHNAEIPLPELEEFRQDFLRRRGFSGFAALACRLAQRAGPVQ